jgi:alpha-L-arabinofuranosidase
MWTQHFGDVLVGNTVDAPTFDLPEQQGFLGPVYDVPYLAVHTSISDDKLYLLVINRHLTDDIVARVHVGGFQPQPAADVYTLNGPSVGATNESGDHEAVVITHTKISDVGTEFYYVFPAHSVTAIEVVQ